LKNSIGKAFRKAVPWIGVTLLLAGIACTVLTLQPHLAVMLEMPIWALSESEREALCDKDRFSGDLYPPQNLDTPEAMQDLLDEHGNPDGYAAITPIGEYRCYYLRLFWFDKGISATTDYLPITDEIASDVPMIGFENYEPVGNVREYALQHGIDENGLSVLYHEWEGIERIIAP
jgi:hypothetical protein